MAFITVSPTSGKGNATLSVTAAKHTGRASQPDNSLRIEYDEDGNQIIYVTIGSEGGTIDLSNSKITPNEGGGGRPQQLTKTFDKEILVKKWRY